MNQDDVLNNKKDTQSPMPEVSAFPTDAEDVDYKRSTKKGKSSFIETGVKLFFGLVVLLAIAGVVFSNLPGEQQQPGSQNDFSVESSSSTKGSNVEQRQVNTQTPAEATKPEAVVETKPAPVTSVNQNQADQVDSSVFELTKNKDVASTTDQVPAAELTKLNQRLDDISARLAELEKKTQSAPAWIDFETLKSEVAELSSASNVSKQRTATKKVNSTQSRNTTRDRLIPREKKVSTPRASVAQANKKEKKQKFTLMAVVQDQAWLSNERGETISLSVAKPVLPGYGRVVLFDGENLKICFDNGSCMQ